MAPPAALFNSKVPDPSCFMRDIHRCQFPQHFVFGTATSAYQVEGAVKEGGRGRSVWDTFSYTPGKIADGSNGDIAVDQYHRYQEDVNLIAGMGFDAYRFSIAWPRIIPDGLTKEANKEGIAYYNRLINSLISQGIEPYATLYHWDLPQALQDSFGGWISRDIVKHFVAYAEVCFAAFGDRVKNWITLNEPHQFSVNGYGTGNHAPGRCSQRSISPAGNSSTEPYLAAHHALLAHAGAVSVYRKNFQAKQGGRIGMACDCQWAEPLTSSLEDKAAAQRRLEFQLSWYLDPIFFGDYPAIMRKHVGDRLPRFTSVEIKELRGSVDFVGINHYTSKFATPGPPATDPSDFFQDQQVSLTVEREGSIIGDRAASEWLFIVPWGLQKVLHWITERYNKPPIILTENGMDDHNVNTASLGDSLNDTKRIYYYQTYLSAVLQAIREGADVRGYFAWSLLDNFEWNMGYSKRFGFYYVDYSNGLKRHAKSSALWFKNFLNPRKDDILQTD
ncbi:hypothetical protein O6H91_03G129100 [Diphasiastrum complanatum]|uniref:Uncharacterized protein n=3 Tax=Diphasiastrum complanatum TaxID=34168 RepID=A0ACC2EBM4_DIPCM|nr:hypothetical protein O6H91_03G129100 [Diphasiastrum complanatum]KAJ7563892.1 hypothetical protein O6H91_03G129100 [Diphasiastrum complanatum]